MADILWPPSLPQDPLFNSYSETVRMPKVVFESDSGAPIERPKTSLRMSEVRCSMDMTSEQLRAFEDFVFYDLAKATRAFFINHPRLAEQVKVRLVGEEPYSFKPMMQGYWEVSLVFTVYR